MTTYLLTWNPNRWDWDTYTFAKMIKSINEGTPIIDKWSCGNTKKIKVGDRVFLIRLGVEPRGIFGSGFVTRNVFEAPHWDRTLRRVGKKSLFIEFKYDYLINPEEHQIISREYLINNPSFSTMNWNAQSSGITIPAEIAENLEVLWAEHNGVVYQNYPDEIEESKSFIEGAKKRITVNAYERNPQARAACISKYGYLCSVCKFDFEKTYGRIGKNFIHVHHKVKISNIGKQYMVNATEDLIPVCPNCHAMLHRNKNETLTVDQLISFIEEQKNG